MKTDPRTSENQKTLWDFSESLLPRKRVGDFNQALMELGSEICTPQNPACDRLPVVDVCAQHFWRLAETNSSGGQENGLRRTSTKPWYWFQRKGKYLVRRCGPGERWEGLWDFPRYRVENQSATAELGPKLQQQFGLDDGNSPDGSADSNTR